ncbi:hypothetical protein [Oceanobacillus kimchii]|uniref:hypothetical protein n=1 Tax=Oceanobacillus kimchii TaxID=746691 RepID=UPI003C751B7C
MLFEIRSVNMRLSEGEVSGVQVVYSARNSDRSSTSNGNFDLTAEEYRGNEAIDRLKEMARDHLVAEAQKPENAE